MEPVPMAVGTAIQAAAVRLSEIAQVLSMADFASVTPPIIVTEKSVSMTHRVKLAVLQGGTQQ